MCLCLIFSWPPAGFSGSSVLLNRACAGISRWGGQGIWDSGAGALDVSVKSASRAVSPITVDCQCPHKVNQVHNRQSFTPRSDGRFLCSARFCSHLTVGVKMSALAVCSSVFLSPENLELCLFVRVTDGQTRRQTVKQRSTAHFERFQPSAGEWESPASCVCTKGVLLFSSRTIKLFTESLDNLAAAALKDVHTQVCTDQSLSYWSLPSLYLSPWLGTKVAYETKLREISLFCLLTTG